MENTRRTQVERSATTRTALIDAARRLWAAHGYAAVGTPEIATQAGVTRGAMYHEFADKAALFRAVAEVVEHDVTRRLADAVAASTAEGAASAAASGADPGASGAADPGASGAADPAAALRAAVDGWLAACEEPEVRQILLLDGPVVLGWDGFRDLALEHGLGLTEALLQAAMDAGQLTAGPTRPLAHVLIGALDEAAMYFATADDREAARAEVAGVLHALLDGLFTRPTGVTEAFAGMATADLAAGRAWYERLLGRPPDLIPNENEAAWQLTQGGWMYVVGDAERAGGSLLTLLVADLEHEVGELGQRGIDAGGIETIPGVVRTVRITDPDGNRITLGQPLR